MPTDKPPSQILQDGLIFAGQQLRIVQNGDDDPCVEILDDGMFRPVTLRPEFREGRIVRRTSAGEVYVDSPTAAFVRRRLKQSTEPEEGGESQ